MAETQGNTEGNLEQLVDHVRELNERIIDSSKPVSYTHLTLPTKRIV